MEKNKEFNVEFTACDLSKLFCKESEVNKRVEKLRDCFAEQFRTARDLMNDTANSSIEDSLNISSYEEHESSNVRKILNNWTGYIHEENKEHEDVELYNTVLVTDDQLVIFINNYKVDSLLDFAKELDSSFQNQSFKECYICCNRPTPKDGTEKVTNHLLPNLHSFTIKDSIKMFTDVYPKSMGNNMPSETSFKLNWEDNMVKDKLKEINDNNREIVDLLEDCHIMKVEEYEGKISLSEACDYFYEIDLTEDVCDDIIKYFSELKEIIK